MNTWDGIFYVSRNDDDGTLGFEFEGDEEALREWIDDPISVYKKYCVIMEDDFSHIDPGSTVGYCEVIGISKAKKDDNPIVKLSFMFPNPDSVDYPISHQLDITSILI